MATKTITATVDAWLSQYQNPAHLLDPKTSPDRVVAMITCVRRDSDPKAWQRDGYTLVGTAEVTLHLVDERAVVENKVTSLRAEKERTLAEAHAKAVELEGQIQKLLAISYDSGSAT